MKTVTLFSVLLIATIGNAQYYGNQPNYHDDYNRNLVPQQGNTYQAGLIVTTNSSFGNYIVTVNNQSSYYVNASNNAINIQNLYGGVNSVMIQKVKRNLFGQERREVIYNSTVTLRGGFETTMNISLADMITFSERQIFINNNNGNWGNNGWGNNSGRGRGNGKFKHRRSRGGCDRD